MNKKTVRDTLFQSGKLLIFLGLLAAIVSTWSIMTGQMKIATSFLPMSFVVYELLLWLRKKDTTRKKIETLTIMSLLSVVFSTYIISGTLHLNLTVQHLIFFAIISMSVPMAVFNSKIGLAIFANLLPMGVILGLTDASVLNVGVSVFATSISFLYVKGAELEDKWNRYIILISMVSAFWVFCLSVEGAVASVFMIGIIVNELSHIFKSYEKELKNGSKVITILSLCYFCKVDNWGDLLNISVLGVIVLIAVLACAVASIVINMLKKRKSFSDYTMATVATVVFMLAFAQVATNGGSLLESNTIPYIMCATTILFGLKMLIDNLSVHHVGYVNFGIVTCGYACMQVISTLESINPVYRVIALGAILIGIVIVNYSIGQWDKLFKKLSENGGTQKIPAKKTLCFIGINIVAFALPLILYGIWFGGAVEYKVYVDKEAVVEMVQNNIVDIGGGITSDKPTIADGEKYTAGFIYDCWVTLENGVFTGIYKNDDKIKNKERIQAKLAIFDEQNYEIVYVLGNYRYAQGLSNDIGNWVNSTEEQCYFAVKIKGDRLIVTGLWVGNTKLDDLSN